MDGIPPHGWGAVPPQTCSFRRVFVEIAASGAGGTPAKPAWPGQLAQGMGGLGGWDGALDIQGDWEPAEKMEWGASERP